MTKCVTKLLNVQERYELWEWLESNNIELNLKDHSDRLSTTTLDLPESLIAAGQLKFGFSVLKDNETYYSVMSV